MRLTNVFRKTLICLAFVVVGIASQHASAQAKKIIIIGDTPQADQPYIDFLQTVSNVALNIEYTSGTYRTLDPTKIANLNSADLIVVTRSANSAEYDDGPTTNTLAETYEWAMLTAPMILFSPFVARTGAVPPGNNARWHWINSNSTEAASTITALTATAPTDRIFAGVAMTGTTVTLFSNQSNSLRALPSTSTNGEILAVRTNAAGTPLIMRWTNTTLPYHGAVSATKPAIGGKRYYLGIFDDANRVIPGATSGDFADQFARLTPAGRLLIKNILGDLVQGVPAEVTQFNVE